MSAALRLSRSRGRRVLAAALMASAVVLLSATVINIVAAVLPAVIVFGLGLSGTVAPVTSAALSAAKSSRAGVASGINNAVARTAQVLAVAVVPWIAGLAGEEIHERSALAAGFPRAMLVMASVALAGGGLAWLTLRDMPLGSGHRGGD